MAVTYQPPLPYEVDRVLCTARIGGFPICPELATHQVEVGCVHEHVGWANVCEEHVPDVLRSTSKCGNCRDIDGHDCVLHKTGHVEPK